MISAHLWFDAERQNRRLDWLWLTVLAKPSLYSPGSYLFFQLDDLSLQWRDLLQPSGKAPGILPTLEYLWSWGGAQERHQRYEQQRVTVQESLHSLHSLRIPAPPPVPQCFRRCVIVHSLMVPRIPTSWVVELKRSTEWWHPHFHTGLRNCRSVCI